MSCNQGFHKRSITSFPDPLVTTADEFLDKRDQDPKTLEYATAGP